MPDQTGGHGRVSPVSYGCFGTIATDKPPHCIGVFVPFSDIGLALILPQHLSLPHAALLMIIALIAGIGITAIGPGGVLLTIALFAMTDLGPAEVAGTAIITHIGTGIAGTLAYVRSGQLRQVQTRSLAKMLAISAIVGTPLGVFINAQVSTRQFGLLLAVFVMTIGATVLIREFHGIPVSGNHVHGAPGRVGQSVVGTGVATISGMFGLGGPMIAVPVLVITGVPMLSALAAAQAQSVIVSITGTVVYLGQGAIDWPLAIMTGIPELIGVWLGWKIAHALPRRLLTVVLGVSLTVLGPVVALNR
jgi:uncharacterized membrane protein YfcA